MRPVRITNICSCQSSRKYANSTIGVLLEPISVSNTIPWSILRADVGNMFGVRRPYVIRLGTGGVVKGEKTPLVRSCSHRLRSSPVPRRRSDICRRDSSMHVGPGLQEDSFSCHHAHTS